MSIPKITIIGGGISGLTCAFKLSQSKEFLAGKMQITVLEYSHRFGGVIETIQAEGCILESGPDSFITNKPALLELAGELGLSSRIIGVNKKHRGALIVSEGKLVPLPAGFVMLAPGSLLSFFQSPLMSLTGKIRVGLDLVIPGKNSREDESLADFVRRRFGQELLERLAQPLVAGIYVGDAERLSADHAAARFVEMERTAGSVIKALRLERKLEKRAGSAAANGANGANGARYGLFASFDQGMSVLVDALVASLNQNNIDLRLNTKVESITARDGRYHVQADETFMADQLVLTVGAGVASQLVGAIEPGLCRKLQLIPSASSAVVTFIFERGQISHPLNAFGAVVPEIEMTKYGLSCLAFNFASVKFPRAPEGKIVIRAFLGGVNKANLLDFDDNHLIELALKDMRLLLGLSGKPHYQAVHRWVESMPQYQVGHLKLIKEIEAALENSTLHLGGAYFSGVGLPDCVSSGSKCASSVLQSLALAH